MPALSWDSLRHRDPHARPLVIAHRGASDDMPENSLAAFRLALDQGAEALETDLRFTRDDEIVLMHDPTLERTTDGAGAVGQLTLGETKKFHTRIPAARASAASGEPPPTLAELLEFSRGEVPLVLELKDDRFLSPADATRLVALLEKFSMLDQCALVSFSLPRLQSVKQIAPRVPIGLITLTHPLPRFPTELLGPFYPLLYVNPFYVRWARRAGKIVCALDPAPEPRLHWYRRLGVPALLSNHPARTRRELARLYTAGPTGNPTTG